ncbi:hypothetical protein [Paenibacillus sp. FSL R5-0519]|uniref:hypothetical protein n=1 Tax=Paenibacillus sp. FSL R5-0519 TaxID=2921648 RepID=UPI0030D9A221
MSIDFDEAYEVWMHSLLEKETNPRVPILSVMPDALSFLLPHRNLLRICESQINTLEEFFTA